MLRCTETLLKCIDSTNELIYLDVHAQDKKSVRKIIDESMPQSTIFNFIFILQPRSF